MTRRRTGTADEDELLAFLDGELTAERQAEIRELCETDWETRARMARVQRRIEKYVEATAHHSPADIPSFDDFWLGLSPQLRETPAHQESAASPEDAISEVRVWLPLFDRLVDRFAWQPSRLQWAVNLMMVLAMCGGVVYLFKSTSIGTVSAQELLHLSAEAENGRADRISEPVVYHRLQMRRRTKSGVDLLAWESWDDTTRSQVRLRVEDTQGERFLRGNKSQTPALLAEYERILAQNRMDSQRPLSAAAYARWRESVRRGAEHVTEISLPDSPQDVGLKLTTVVVGPHAPDSIIEASLIVRRSDWHPVAQSLKVQGDNEIREYELGELAYGVLPSQALAVSSGPSPAGVARPSATPLRPTVASVSPAPAPSPTAAPSAAALMEAETAALYALHRVQADLGEQIEVLREADRQIVVQGLVETDARKQQLTEALADIALLAVRIQSVEEVVRQAAKQTQPVVVIPADESRSESATRRSAFEQTLSQHFAVQGESRKNAELKVVEFSNAAMAGTSAMISQAWALRRLSERFAAERELPAPARQRVEEMLGHHIAALQERLRLLRGHLGPVLSVIAGGDDDPAAAALPAPEPDWQGQALTVFRSAEHAHQLAGRLFSSGQGPAEAPAQAARQLLDGVAKLDGALQILSRQIAR